MTTSSDVIAGLELALASADAMIERLHKQVAELEASPMSEEALDILRGENTRLRSERAILRDSAKDVIAWCDKTGSGDALYCIDRMRHAIAATESPNG